jgi:hypothetical protein
MIRRVDNARVGWSGWRKNSPRVQASFYLGNKTYIIGKRTREEMESMELESQSRPVCFCNVGEKYYWKYKGRFFVENDCQSSDDVLALLATRDLRQEQQLKRAKMIAGSGSLSGTGVRRSIPDDLKLLVWTRDGGSCAKCGSNNELQYDHVIPLSQGGATSEENLQVLCGPCNRAKGTSVV